MRKQKCRSPSRRPHMDAGVLGSLVETFAEHVVTLGYSRLTVTGFSEAARHFCDWLCRCGIALNDIDEAILCMQKALDYYYQHDDYRAVFLRAYYLIILDVHAAIHQAGDYQKQIFFDPG